MQDDLKASEGERRTRRGGRAAPDRAASARDPAAEAEKRRTRRPVGGWPLTIILCLNMLVLGIIGGFLGRPLIDRAGTGAGAADGGPRGRGTGQRRSSLPHDNAGACGPECPGHRPGRTAGCGGSDHPSLHRGRQRPDHDYRVRRFPVPILREVSEPDLHPDQRAVREKGDCALRVPPVCLPGLGVRRGPPRRASARATRTPSGNIMTKCMPARRGRTRAASIRTS